MLTLELSVRDSELGYQHEYMPVHQTVQAHRKDSVDSDTMQVFV